MEEKSNGRREHTYKEMYVRKNRIVDGVKKTGQKEKNRRNCLTDLMTAEKN